MATNTDPSGQFDHKPLETEERMGIITNRADEEAEIPLSKRQSFFFEKQQFDPIEVFWDDITITAEVPDLTKKAKFLRAHPKTTKTILNNVKGVARPGTFTAILGPSGCGKTTLLNFLSGRVMGKNLKASGSLYVNSNSVENLDIIGNKMAYVMQDDILMPTFTPREAFHFSAALRLRDTPQERHTKVESLLKDLGLLKCANTWIGNDLIRGISGGERKRTSIGVELLTNPSLIFLDEPTTGLDSATAANLIQLLRDLAKFGRTIISTIHQPSSDIFEKFDRLMLMVNGNIIYEGVAMKGIEHFRAQGYNCPEFSNPSTFFMQCMNPEGLLIQQLKERGEEANIELNDDIKNMFQVRVEKMVNFHKNSVEYKSLGNSLKTEVKWDRNVNSAGFLTQFKMVTLRGILNQLKDPMSARLQVFVTIFMALLVIIVFNELGEGIKGVQSRSGIIFFIVTIQSFASIQNSILTFAAEKPLFVRESLNRTYTAATYFLGKTTSELPIHLLTPVLSVTITYFVVGLNLEYAWKFFVCMLLMNGVYFFGASYGFTLSAAISNAEVALSLIPVLIVPFMLFCGFFINVNDIPYVFYPFVYLSMFKYGYAAGLQNEFQDKTDPNCQSAANQWEEDNKGVSPYSCDPLKDFDFREPLWLNILLLYVLGIAFRTLCYLALRKISNPTRLKLASKQALIES